MLEIKRSYDSYKWENGTPLLFVTIAEKAALIEELIKQVLDSKYKYDLLVSLGQSGIPLGVIFSKVLDIPHAIFRAKAYNESLTNQSGTKHQVIVAKHSLFIDQKKNFTSLPYNLSHFYENVLVVDHLIDSGDSITAVIEDIQARHPGNNLFHTACLWRKSWSKYKANYVGMIEYPEPLTGIMPWIVEPDEVLIKKLREKINLN